MKTDSSSNARGVSPDFSEYMNPPECSVNIGDICKRIDMDCENPYIVKRIEKRGNKFYAICSHKDEFSDEEVEEVVYHFYLEKN